jgi:hypothetical protein
MDSTLTQIAKRHTAQEFIFLGQKSISWLKENMRGLRAPVRLSREIIQESVRKGGFQIGGLCQFYYDPKTKETIKYYDTFPLVIPLHMKNGANGEPGFLGLNLHYLPPLMRASFLDKLSDFAVYNKSNEIARLKVTYDILAATSRYKEFKPCIKHYLNSQIRSDIMGIRPGEWETAIFLPTAQFKKASQAKVHSDSIKNT